MGKRVTLDTVRRLALELPGVEEGESYGTPAFRIRKKFFARLREDGESVVVKLDFDARELLMEADPKSFFITEHYRNHPMVLVRLSSVRTGQLRDVLEQAWRRIAPKRVVAAYDDARPS